MFEYEFEAEYDREGEYEYASEYENEEFFPALLPLLKIAAPMAINSLGGLFKRRRRRRGQREFEFEYENEFESNPFSMAMGEGEFEAEDEYEFEAGPMNESEALLEHLAYKAATSESEAEAEAFLGALVPLVTQLIPSATKAVTAAAPALIQGISSIGSSLYRDPSTRRLLQTAPGILKGAVTNLAHQANRGQSIDSSTAIRALAGSTSTMFRNPRRVARTMKRSHRAQHVSAKRNSRRQPTFA